MGDGTFGERIGFDTGVGGEASLVAGDFNSDGNLDVATGNQSVVSDERFGRQLWDSVSIMPGDGTGRLLAATTYAWGRSMQPTLLTKAILNTRIRTGSISCIRRMSTAMGASI